MKLTSKLRVEQIQDESDEQIIDDFSGAILKNMSIETELVEFLEHKIERKRNPLLHGIENANITCSLNVISSKDINLINILLDRICVISMDAETMETAKELKRIINHE